MKRGIAIAGNMIVDMLYPTNGLPRPGELVTITGEMTRSTGGCLCNDIIDLATLDPALPLTALGRVGDDEAADYVLDKLRACPNIDLGQVKRGGTTSYTLVMDDEVRKQRSFFQCRGANADFRESDIDWDALDADLLHVGYILLLDALDAPDEVYGTKMARLLHTAKQRGIKTSIDVVSEAGERFRHIVVPALKYTDYCVINELEAQGTTGVPLLALNVPPLIITVCSTSAYRSEIP
jgi:sugar/nucleoside kinase (ribokinase family)